MPIRVHCQCGQSLAVPQQKAGLRVRCPVCDEYLTIPDAPATGPTELVAAATTKVQAEIVAAISGEQRSKVRASGKKQPKSASKPIAQKGVATVSDEANERSISSPPVPARPRPEPRVAAPRAAPQPPPRKPKPAAEAAPQVTTAAASASPMEKSVPASPSVPPARPSSAKASAAPPPLPTAKASPAVAVAEVAPPPPVAPLASATPAAIDKRPSPDLQPAQQSAGLNDAEGKTETVRGVEHDPSKRYTVYLISFGLALLAMASMYPAIVEIVRHIRDPLSPGVENWTYLVLFVGGLQIVYSIYLAQLPDWSSVWVAMAATSVVATLYAVGMGMSLMAAPDNEVIAVLGLTQLHEGGYLTLWCLLLTLLTALLSYTMVRTSVKWHKMFQLATAHIDKSAA